MRRISIKNMCDATGCALVCGDPSLEIGVALTDSREVGPGALFVCVPGERVDGNDFAERAVAAGATAVVATRVPDEALVAACRAAGCALVRARDDDPVAFLLELAAWWRAQNPQWKVVAITGSVGKTTTKEMLVSALSTTWRVHATRGNLNSLIGLPRTIIEATPDDEVVVAEMGMDHPGEVGRMSRAARPDVAVITNVGTSHIGILGSREAIACAKAEVVEGMSPTEAPMGGVRPMLGLCSSDGFTDFIEERFARPAGVEVVRVGEASADALRASDVTLDASGRASFTAAATGWSRAVTLASPGAHLVDNYLLALAVAERLGADLDRASAAIEQMPPTHMRLETVGGADGVPRVIDDTYNASPSSMAAALDVLATMACEGRRVAVLGEIAELGDQSDLLHGYVGAYAAASGIDQLIVVGDAGAWALAEAARTMGLSAARLRVVPNVDEAVAALRDLVPALDERDLVLVKASRSRRLDLVVKGVLA